MKQRLFATILVIAILIQSLLPVVVLADTEYKYLFDNASGKVYRVKTSDGWNFMFFEGMNRMVCNGYEGSSRKIILPAEIDGHPVTLGDMTIPFNQIERFEIPECFSEVDSYTFGNISDLQRGCTIVIHNRDAEISLPIGVCKSMGFVLSGYTDSTTEQYANSNDLPFTAIVRANSESPYLTIEAGFDKGLSASAFGGRGMDIGIDSNTDWNIRVTKGSEWITISCTTGSGQGSFYTTIATNNDGNKREGYIEITATECKTIKIKVTQDASIIEDDNVLSYESLLAGAPSVVASIADYPPYISNVESQEESFEMWYRIDDGVEQLASNVIYIDNKKASQIALWCKSNSTWAQPNANHRYRFEVLSNSSVIELGQYDYQGIIGSPGTATVLVHDDDRGLIIGSIQIVVCGGNYDIYPISEYYHQATRHLILHDKDVMILLYNHETKQYYDIKELPDYQLKIVSYGENAIKYKNGKVYCSKKTGAGLAQLQLIYQDEIVSTILVSSNTVIAPSECTGFTSIDALVENSNKRSFFGENGFAISQNIELFDVECWEKHDKPEQYPNGYYIVAFDAYNSSVAAYGIKTWTADMICQDGITFIDGYTHTISFFKAMADWGSSLRNDIDDKKIGVLTGESEEFKKKTEVLIEVPMGGMIQFVQMSDDNDTLALNILNYIFAIAETNTSLANVLVPGTDSVTAIDVHKVLDKLSESAKQDMCKAMIESVKLGDPESIKNILMGEGSIGWANQVKAAIRESVVEGTLDTIEDLLLLAGFKPGYFILNGADFINKGLMLTQYTNIILQELVNTDHLLVDAVYFPNATNPALI